MTPKVIYLCYLPLIPKRETDFYMNELTLQGFTVEYWDLTEMFFPNIRWASEVERSYIRKISNYKELKDAMLAQDLENCVFVSIVTFEGKVIKLHRILTKYKCYLIFFARSGLPIFTEGESWVRKITDNYRNYLRIDKIKAKLWYETAKL